MSPTIGQLGIFTEPVGDGIINFGLVLYWMVIFLGIGWKTKTAAVIWMSIGVALTAGPLVGMWTLADVADGDQGLAFVIEIGLWLSLVATGLYRLEVLREMRAESRHDRRWLRSLLQMWSDSSDEAARRPADRSADGSDGSTP